jgi:hypothetical protein
MVHRLLLEDVKCTSTFSTNVLDLWISKCHRPVYKVTSLYRSLNQLNIVHVLHPISLRPNLLLQVSLSPSGSRLPLGFSDL